MYLWIFHFPSSYWFLVSYRCGQWKYLFPSSCIFWLALWPNTWPILENLHVHLRRMYILLSSRTSVCLLGSLGLASFIQILILCLLLILCLDDLSIIESGVLKTPNYYYITVYFSFLALNFALCVYVLQCWAHKYFQLLYLLDILALWSLYNDFCLFITFKVCFVWF